LWRWRWRGNVRCCCKPCKGVCLPTCHATAGI
jgi:hypothetical protein